MPWQVSDKEANADSFKYQYHPRGDKNAAVKNAPSALNTVVIPNVTLPKVSQLPQIETTMTQWDPIGTMLELIVAGRTCTRSSTSGERKDMTDGIVLWFD